MSNIILYHSKDLDGQLSRDITLRALARRKSRYATHCVGWDYGQPLPQLDDSGSPVNWNTADAIYVVDLSCEKLFNNPLMADKIVWIDHHRSAILKWGDKFKGLRIDGVAACRLCWQYFFNPDYHQLTADSFKGAGVDEPLIVELVGRYDVFDLSDPDVLASQYGLRALPPIGLKTAILHGLDGRDKLVHSAIEVGDAIVKYEDNLSKIWARERAHTIKWEGLTFCVMNGVKGSRAFQYAVCAQHDALMAWSFDGTEVHVSLYQTALNSHIDLSLVAVKYGGGGHKGACGFRVSLDAMTKILANGV